MVHNIPVELQQLDQWVCATGELMPDGKRNKEPLNPRTGYAASVIDPSTWGTFQEAQQCGYPLIGFVLSKSDPYTIIDLDAPETEEQQERHAAILEAFPSYAEVSQSGQGVHIIVRGSIPHGVRRDKVEIYSDSRYMICTGVIIKPFPIIDAQEKLDHMFGQMESEAATAELIQIDGDKTDEELYTMARHAANGHKFEELWVGDWRAMHYPSQSEADFALLSIIAFYTKDNEQVRRIFRYSPLGQREKAQKNNRYLDFALSKIRGKDQPAVDFSALLKHTQHALAHEDRTTESFSDTATDRPAIDSESTTDDSRPAEDNAPTSPTDSGRNEISFPPGFIGELASYILASAIRPVPEIALATALALTAGVCGRTYNVSGSGLNQYLILLARTGSGKEGIGTGIDALVSAVRPQIPMVDEFIGPSAFASGQALIRVLDKSPCFVSVLGEFGLTLQSLCDPKANNAQLILKKVLLDIYAKSGFSKVLRSSVYSEAEKNTKIIQGPNVTILGESTPENFYDALDSSAVAQGLIPRFSIFDYSGPRPAKNPNAFQPPGKDLVDKFAAILTVALAAQQNRVFCGVSIDQEAHEMLESFDQEADQQMRGDNDIVLQLWNRAHLKAIKLAALIAVGENPHAPCIRQASAAWAINLTRRDIAKLLAKFGAGEIGSGDTRLEADVRRAVRDYLEMNPARRAGFGTAERIRKEPVIPIGFLRRRCRTLVSFRGDRRGSSLALSITLKSMIEAHELIQINPVQAAQQFGISSPLYAIGPNW